MKANFENQYTSLQKSVINRLAEIEQEDADACARCGGEDCICCEIYHDRMKWKSPDELFSDDDFGFYDREPNGFYCEGCGEYCDEWCDKCNMCSDCCECEN